MAKQTIQGFFLGGAMRHPVERARPLTHHIVTAASRGPERVKPAPGPPLTIHSGAAQRFGGNGSFDIDPAQIGLARSGGKALPQALLTKMEAAFGADFSAVRVHVGPQAARIGAIAFTTGNDLYFAPGRFQPDSIQGQQLIGHELAHVVQQRQGRVRAPGSGVAVVQDHALEAEADRLGMRAAAHRMPVQAKLAADATRQGMTFRISNPIADGKGGYRVTAGISGREIGSVRLHPGVGHAVEVTDLGVEPGYREQGVGKQLLATVARMGMQLGKPKVSLAAQDDGSGRLTRWYKSMGFAQTGTNGRGMARLESAAGLLLAGAMQRKSAPLLQRPGHPSALCSKHFLQRASTSKSLATREMYDTEVDAQSTHSTTWVNSAAAAPMTLFGTSHSGGGQHAEDNLKSYIETNDIKDATLVVYLTKSPCTCTKRKDGMTTLPETGKGCTEMLMKLAETRNLRFQLLIRNYYSPAISLADRASVAAVEALIATRRFAVSVDKDARSKAGKLMSKTLHADSEFDEDGFMLGT